MEKQIEEMTYEELKAEIKYTVSLLDDQPCHHEAYLLALTEALMKKSIEVLDSGWSWPEPIKI